MRVALLNSQGAGSNRDDYATRYQFLTGNQPLLLVLQIRGEHRCHSIMLRFCVPAISRDR